MFHRLCGSPSIPLSFTFASVIPRRETSRVSLTTAPNTGSAVSFHRLRLKLLGYLILITPLAFVSERQEKPSTVPSPYWCSFRYLRISPLHRKFPVPLLPSSMEVSFADPRLSRRISQKTFQTAYRRFTPNQSE